MKLNWNILEVFLIRDVLVEHNGELMEKLPMDNKKYEFQIK